MRAVTTTVELGSVTADPLLHWVAQGFDGRGSDGRVRAWRDGDAVVVGCGQLARLDRLAVTGPADRVVGLVRHALGELGPTFRVLGDEALVRAVVARVDGLVLRTGFGWMQTRQAPPPGEGVGVYADEAQLTALIDLAFPGSFARPGLAGVGPWWAVLGQGAPVACAARAWSAPGVGHLGGVAVHPDHRGRGLAGPLVATALADLVGRHGLATLIADAHNVPARRVYAGLGMSWRPLGAGSVAR